MRPFTLLIGGIFTSVVSANALLGENAFELLNFYSVRSIGQAAVQGGSLQKRACMATCSNGGCCNTGGPCTTDGMCCSTGEIACTDGGCCKTGETCTSVNGTQICQGAIACVSPPVTCGSACCDAGNVCLTTGTNYRCQDTAAASLAAKTSSVSRPPLGNPTNRTNTVSVSFTGIASGTKVIPYVTPTTFPSASATGASTSSASSSATKQSVSVSGLQLLVNIAGGVGLLAALVLMN